MDSLLRFTLRQKVVFNLLFAVLIVIGAFSLLSIPVDRYPNINFGKMYINTYLPGGSPEEVEQLVTAEIEKGLQNMEDIDYIRSASYRERSNIVIKFIDDSDYRRLYDDVRIRVLALTDELPREAEPPEFNLLDVGDWFPAVSVNISGNHTNTTLKQVAEEIRIPLAALPGVSKVRLLGEQIREYHLMLAPDKMERFGLTFRAVEEALKSAGASIPAGHVLTPGGEFSIRVDEQFKSGQQLLQTIIRTDSDGSFIRLVDITSRGIHTYREPHILASVNGESCITLQVAKSENGNALSIARDVRKAVDRLKPHYQLEEITLTVTQDSSTRIKDSMRVLGVNLLAGIILVCIIIWLFMGFRNAALTTIGIPFAFLVTLLLMRLTGNSVNEVSLFAFVLVSGIIVDDAIVVVENIYRHTQEGRPLNDAIVQGTSEVFLPVVSATLTTIAAFLPMLLMTGMVGDFFAIIPKTIIFALIASLLECLFILPCHYFEFGHRSPGPDIPSHGNPDSSYEDEGPLMRGTRNLLNRMVVLCLENKYTTQAGILLIFIGTMVMFVLSFLGKSDLIRIQFFPDNYSVYYVEVFAPAGTPIEETDRVIRDLSGRIHDSGAEMAESVLGFTGYYIDNDFAPQYGPTYGHIAVTLPASDNRKFADYPENDVITHLEYIRTMLEPNIPKRFVFVVRPEKDGPPMGRDVTVRVVGSNENNVTGLSEKIHTYLKGKDGPGPWLTDLKDDTGYSNTLFRVRVNREKTAEWGLTPTHVATLAASVINGSIVNTMKLADEQIDIILKIEYREPVQLTDILSTPVIDHPNGAIRLGDLCTFQYYREPGKINRFQQQRAITLTADIKPSAPLSAAMVVDQIDRYYSSIRQQFPGAALLFAGEYESTTESFTSLTYAFAAAMLLIYLILAAQFRAYLQPMIIISAVIFALIGVILGIFISRTLFTINSFVAVIGVTGVVVNDSLLLLAFLNRCHSQGMDRRKALMEATNTRMRPILLTTLTTTLGLLPMALGIPEYSTIWGSMAMTFVTGLCTATFLTILFVPVQWDILQDLTSRSASKPYPEN